MRYLEFSVHEYDSLRNELVQRIGMLQSSAVESRIFVFTLWGLGFTALSLLGTRYRDLMPIYAWLIGCGTGLIFMFTMVLLLPAANKQHENLYQIMAISCYIRVFFEYSPMQSTSNRFAWETQNTITNQYTNPNRAKNKVKGALYNPEHFILGIASTIFVAASGALSWHLLKNWILLVTYGIMLAFTLVTVCRLYQLSRLYTVFVEAQKDCLKTYINNAVELGVFNKADAAQIFDNLYTSIRDEQNRRKEQPTNKANGN